MLLPFSFFDYDKPLNFIDMSEITWEFKIVSGAQVDCQKTINQWKHQYDLKIHTCLAVDEQHVKIFLVRTPK